MWMRESGGEAYCRPGSSFRVPEDGGVLLRHFAGRRARIEEVSESGAGRVVTFNVAGVRVRCPLAYLANALRRVSGVE